LDDGAGNPAAVAQLEENRALLKLEVLPSVEFAMPLSGRSWSSVSVGFCVASTKNRVGILDDNVHADDVVGGLSGVDMRRFARRAGWS